MHFSIMLYVVYFEKKIIENLKRRCILSDNFLFNLVDFVTFCECVQCALKAFFSAFAFISPFFHVQNIVFYSHFSSYKVHTTMAWPFGILGSFFQRCRPRTFAFTGYMVSTIMLLSLAYLSKILNFKSFSSRFSNTSKKTLANWKLFRFLDTIYFVAVVICC